MGLVKFTKMHGLGNDFILFDGISDRLISVDWSEVARRVCDRNIGIGADGILLGLPSDTADLGMRIINSDGSEAEISGNGLRCLVRLMHDRKHISSGECRVETGNGIVTAEIGVAGQADGDVRLTLNPPVFEACSVPIKTDKTEFLAEGMRIDGEKYTVTALSVGNPHAVMFVDDFDFDWRSVGAKIETHEMFPEKTNVEFVQILSHDKVRLKSWERGAGPTHASGTGACAAATAGIKLGKLGQQVEVVCDFGSLTVEWSGGSEKLFQTGPTAHVFEGEIELDIL